MNYTNYVRKPFVVEAIEITEENIEELAPLIGTIDTKEDGSRFIAVNRRLVPNVYRVFPGFWMTRLNGNVNCYSKRIFNEQFVEATDDIQGWVDYLRGKRADDPVVVTGGSVEPAAWDGVDDPSSTSIIG